MYLLLANFPDQASDTGSTLIIASYCNLAALRRVQAMFKDSGDSVFAISRVKDPQFLKGRGGLFSTQRGIAFFKRLPSRNHLSEERGREARIESEDACDAIAVAICHATHTSTDLRLRAAR